MSSRDRSWMGRGLSAYAASLQQKETPQQDPQSHGAGNTRLAPPSGPVCHSHGRGREGGPNGEVIHIRVRSSLLPCTWQATQPQMRKFTFLGFVGGSF